MLKNDFQLTVSRTVSKQVLNNFDQFKQYTIWIPLIPSEITRNSVDHDNAKKLTG